MQPTINPMPSFLLLDRWAARLFILAIHIYRRTLSPHKGFKCPHEILYQQGSCSAYGLSAVRTHGFKNGLTAINERFADCKKAAMIMAASQTDQEGENTPDDAEDNASQSNQKKKDRNSSWKQDWCADCSIIGASSLPACGDFGHANSPSRSKPDPSATRPSNSDGPGADHSGSEGCSSINVDLPDCSVPDCAPSCSW